MTFHFTLGHFVPFSEDRGPQQHRCQGLEPTLCTFSFGSLKTSWMFPSASIFSWSLLKKQCHSFDSDHLFPRVPTETSEVYTWKPKRNQSLKRRVWKVKARLGILPSKTPTWRRLRLRQADFRRSSVLYVLSPLWLRPHSTLLSRDDALLKI